MTRKPTAPRWALLYALAVLTGCAEVSSGEQPATPLPPGLQPQFEAYMNKVNRGAFAVSVDGSAAGWSFCPQYAGCGQRNEFERVALEGCRSISNGVPCKIYAWRGKVVWKGEAPAPSRLEYTGETANSASDNSVPASYLGPIEPITEVIPVVLTPGFSVECAEVEIDNTGSEPDVVKHGRFDLRDHELGVSGRYTFEDEENRPYVEFVARLSNSGKIEEIEEIGAHGFNNSAGKISESVKELVKKYFVSGVIFDSGANFPDIYGFTAEEMFRDFFALLLPAATLLSLEDNSAVIGRTTQQGEEFIVFYFDIAMQFVSGNRDFESAIVGYSLIHIDSGLSLEEKDTLTISENRQQLANFSINKTCQFLERPETDVRYDYKLNTSIRAKLTLVKQLLEDGLITPDEAEQKRREILENL